MASPSWFPLMTMAIGPFGVWTEKLTETALSFWVPWTATSPWGPAIEPVSFSPSFLRVSDAEIGTVGRLDVDVPGPRGVGRLGGGRARQQERANQEGKYVFHSG